MKVVILAGGFGTRISEESAIKPKPMITIGGVPILIHIMRYFYKNGFKEFIICGGYKCDHIKEYFSKYNLINSDFTIDNINGEYSIIRSNNNAEKWKVSIVDTGIDTQTAGRLKLIEKHIDGDFIMTYGDGLSDVDLNKLIETHKKHNGLVTLTAVEIRSKFGFLNINGTEIDDFSEKTMAGGGWVNAGYMIIKKEVLNYIENLQDSFEFNTLPKIASMRKLFAYKHKGFWKCMDTLKDKKEFEEIILKGIPPWQV